MPLILSRAVERFNAQIRSTPQPAERPKPPTTPFGTILAIAAARGHNPVHALACGVRKIRANILSRSEPKSDLRVLVIVPAYNEADRIESVLGDLFDNAGWADVAVVDDGSVDATAVLAEQAGAMVLALPFNLGVGAAMQTGYLYAHEKGYDVAVQFDGDGQHRADQIGRLVTELTDSHADLVVGSRLLGRRSYRFSPSRWLGSRLLVGAIAMLTGLRISDPTSGFRVASRRMIKFFAHYYPQAYLGDTVEALAVAARHGMKVHEIPARMRMPNRSSVGKITGLIHTIRICLALLIDRIERNFPAPPDDDESHFHQEKHP